MGSPMMQPRTTMAEVLADVPDVEPVVWDDALRERNNTVLRQLLDDEVLVARVRQRGVNRDLVPDPSLVERIVNTYNAPHLMPVDIKRRLDEGNDAAAWSFVQLLKYMQQM